MQGKKDKLNEQFKKISNKDTTIQAEIEQSNKKRKKLQEQVKDEEKRVSSVSSCLLRPGNPF